MSSTEEALDRAALADPFRQFNPAPGSLVGMLVADSDLIRSLVAERDQLQARITEAVRYYEADEFDYQDGEYAAAQSIIDIIQPDNHG